MVYRLLQTTLLLFLIILILPSVVSTIKYSYFPFLEPKTAVGVIPINETIDEASTISQSAEQLFKQSSIKAVALKIDSCGGAAGSCEIIFNEIQRLKLEHAKPVVCIIENICTSGAYWIACAADYIIAPGTAVIGGIGARFCTIFHLNNLLEQYKIQSTTIKAGKYKAVGDPFTHSLQEDDKAMLQKVVDDSYQQFLHAVMQSRSLDQEKIMQRAEGQLFTGQQAKQLGLIDEIGSINSVSQYIKQKIVIDGEIEWMYAPKKQSFLGQWFCKEDHLFAQLYNVFIHLREKPAILMQ